MIKDVGYPSVSWIFIFLKKIMLFTKYRLVKVKAHEVQKLNIVDKV